MDYTNIGKTVSQVKDGVITFTLVDYDESAEDPTTWDGVGHIYSGNRRHKNYRADYESLDGVGLSYSEHELCKWEVYQFYRGRSFFYDGMWMPDEVLEEQLRDVLPQDKPNALREWARQACEIYTKWCNGEVYWVKIAAYPVRYDCGNLYDQPSDYRFDTPLFTESCGELYEDMVDEYIQEVLHD